ncbi:PREDICTED: uncharacterized protein LOC105362393 [Ceratosolen solmsi marchali]|uniref:Uncharacterized protein LOC105362393 n=1 Tax=Ceratosolen solmsi marchali TaxID=326594 RepID=A0AAJ7DVP5_9HYME|nr:PREDICTED: uncharacterized protein LOC105362393 [Ceratosolen solmsi marchali]
MVRHPRGTFLHHNFVCAVLNDVFGVQARGGCACAGRYAHDLMGIDEKLAKEYEALLLRSGQSDGGRDETNAETLRPGFARLTFPYFMSEAEVAFVLEALKMVATEGWKLLPQYVLNPDTGEWRHHTNSVFKDRRWLGSIRYTDGRMNATERRVSGPGVFPQSYGDSLQTARNIFNRARKMAQRYPMQIDRSVSFDEKSEALRWFMLPHEAQDLLLGHSQNVKHHVPFDPSTYKLAQFEASWLNNDASRSTNPLVSPNSPRHRSLPALSCPAELRRVRGGPKPTSETDDDDLGALGQKSPATCPGSPMPSIRFAVGEAVTTAAAGILGSGPTITRLIGSEQQRSASSASATPTNVDSGSGSPDSAKYIVRGRCNSLGSSSSCPVRCGTADGTSSPVPIPLSPQTLASLGIAAANTQSRHRHCSCSSQTELNASLDSDANGSPGRSASSLGHVPNISPGGSCSSSFDSALNTNRLGRSSPVLMCARSHSSEDDLRAYLKEVTKELATEIKSEIREVISKVDDALSESNATDHHRPLEKQQHHDSFSASDIAEYLMEFSKEMASEVKSEIRCMVNSVDGLHRYSPDEKSSSGCASPAERRRTILPGQSSSRSRTPVPMGKLTELSSQQHDSKMSSECSSDETVIYVVKPSPSEDGPGSIVDGTKAVNTNTNSNNTDDDDEGEHSEPDKTLPKIYSAVNSVSSQDSGINLSFHDSDRSVDGSVGDLGRSSSAEFNTNGCCARRPRFGNANPSSLCKQSRAAANDDLSEDDEIFFTASQQTPYAEGVLDTGDEQHTGGHWHCPPKNIWKPTVEAMQEFDMIKDNDRILLCLAPGGKSSLTLLHTLRQYRFYARSKGIDFEIGVASVCDYGSEELAGLATYFKALNVPYFNEGLGDDGKETETKDSATSQDGTRPVGSCTSFCEKATRAKLYALAKGNGYNVLALGQNLDDLTEGFLSSVFHNGRLRTMKAHYYIREQSLRVVRPFVYVREKALKLFIDNKKLPIFVDLASESGESVRKKKEDPIGRQEMTYPRLYWSLRSALRPLISAQGLGGESEQPYKRQQHRRPRTNSFSALPLVTTTISDHYASTSSAMAGGNHHQRIEDSEETDEEPVI